VRHVAVAPLVFSVFKAEHVAGDNLVVTHVVFGKGAAISCIFLHDVNAVIKVAGFFRAQLVFLFPFFGVPVVFGAEYFAAKAVVFVADVGAVIEVGIG